MNPYYRILGVPHDATLSDVKSAYRKMVRQWHPDRHSHDPHMLKLAEETLKDVNHAYREILGHLAAKNTLTAAMDRPGKKHHTGSDRRHQTLTVIAAIVRTGNRLMNRIRNTARKTRHTAERVHSANRVGGSIARRFTATFDHVLREVAAEHRLGFKNTDGIDDGMKPHKRVRRYPHPGSIAQRRSGDPGPVSPVERVGPVRRLRRKR